MYCKGSAFFIITSKYKVESIVLSKSFDISYNYYPPQNTIAELSYCFYIVWNLTIYLFETFILGVIKGVNHITHWFTPLFAERGKWTFFSTPCIIAIYTFLFSLCNQIVATREYFESTHRYCYEKYTLVFIAFKGTKNMNYRQIFDWKSFRKIPATISVHGASPYI